MAKESEEKKSFKLYNSYARQFEKLEDSSAGQLIKAIFAYVNNQELPQLDDLGADMAFSFICSQLDRDAAAYDRKCEINRRNGGLGGRPKKTEENRAVSDEPDAFQKNRSVSEVQNQPTQGRSHIQYPKAFEQFWEIYPRKEGKGECYKKFQTRMKDGYSEDELIAAARAYRAHIQQQHTESKYIKLGKTFLSDSLPFLDFLKNAEAGGQPTAARRDPHSNPYGSK